MAAFTLATKTLTAIEEALIRDQGASFRLWEAQVLPHIGDAYRGYDEPHREHLGASVIGKECARSIWYSYRWAVKPLFNGQILRLFNRGHLEEGRFIALLLMIGVQVYQQDQNGKQYRISHYGGLFGGSGDGIAIGIPDLEPTQSCVLEFKTHSDKSYQALAKEGVRASKHEHYVQMQIYMHKMGIPVSLYMAVNKNNDAIHAELVTYNRAAAEEYLNRAEKIIDIEVPPKKINQSPGFYKCKWCSERGVCHLKEKVDINCRTCEHSRIVGLKWTCKKFQKVISEMEGLNPKQGCPSYQVAGWAK